MTCLFCSGSGCSSCRPDRSLPSPQPAAASPADRWGKLFGAAQSRNAAAGKHPTGRVLPLKGEPAFRQRCKDCVHRVNPASSARCGLLNTWHDVRSTQARVKVSWSACADFKVY